jgi:hypothetical protein
MKLQKGMWYAGIYRGQMSFGRYLGAANGHLCFIGSPFCNDYGKMQTGIPSSDIADWMFIPLGTNLPTETGALEIVIAALYT